MKVYVLMQDDDMTMRSSPTPIGYYVTSEEAAKDFVNNPPNNIYKNNRIYCCLELYDASKCSIYHAVKSK